MKHNDVEMASTYSDSREQQGNPDNWSILYIPKCFKSRRVLDQTATEIKDQPPFSSEYQLSPE